MSITTIHAIKSTVKYTDAWLPTRDRNCANPNCPTMPVGLIVFGDKSHTNLHRTLAMTPIIFTLTLFNWPSRNNTRFLETNWLHTKFIIWKSGADCRKTSDKLQDDHTCLSCIFESLRKITREGGFNLVVLGQNIHVKVWIHYFIGDTEGNNKWLGQYSGNCEGVEQPC
jgi:hypothetical protein